MPIRRTNVRLLLFVAAIVVLGAKSWFVEGQILHANGDRPSFEVASIKPWKRTPAPPRASDGSAGPVKVKASPVAREGQATNRVHVILPAALLIASAYGLPIGSESRLLKGPEWLQDNIDQYEIEAKIDDAEFAAMQKMTPAQQRDQVALMEQSLLADRFKLKVHFEPVEMPVYALVVAKGGTKMKAAPDGETSGLTSQGNAQGMKMTASAVTLEEFVRSPLLTGPAGRQVVDQTGMKGAYDFTLTWDPQGAIPVDAAKTTLNDAPSLFTAVQDQLGLRLVPSRAPVEVIVIDHVERPSAN